MRNLGTVLAHNLYVFRLAMDAMHRNHIRAEKAYVAEELRVVHPITSRGSLQLESCFRHMRRDEYMLLIGQLPGQAVPLLIEEAQIMLGARPTCTRPPGLL